jgi:hypothetical protein
MRDYPPCGTAADDPALWFPRGDDCAVDPDAASCGQPSCDEGEDFAHHLLTAHWPRGRAFIGNHCANGLQDYDETDIDAGGVCDLLGR